MTKVMHLITTVVTLILVGCAATTETTVRPYEYSHKKETLLGGGGQAPEVTREYKGNYDEVWNAAVAVVQEMGHPIQTINKESGTLTTDWLPRPGAPFLMGMPFNHFQDRFSIRVLKIGDVTVQIGIRRTMQMLKNDKYRPKTSDGEIEQWLLDEITSKVSASN